MKKIVSTLLVCVLLIGCVLTLASCAKTLSGTYSASVGDLTGTTYVFDGKNVTVKYMVLTFEKIITGTYEITENEEGEAVIIFTFADGTDGADSYKGEHSFNEGVEDDVEYIKIDGVKYVKQEEK